MIDLSTGYVKNIIKERPYDMHKGDAGRVLIVSGSKGMAGAAVLCARGALYSGSGLVTIAVPEELFNILQISVPEAMCIERESLKKSRLNSFDVVAVGPGIGINEESMKVVGNILTAFDGPVVIDADGLNCLCEYREIEMLKSREHCTVLTPHPGEADRLLRTLNLSCLNELGREKAARLIEKETGAITLLKGAGTLIAADGDVFFNPTGNPGMATGGSGDVLTGIIASLLGQKYLEGTYAEKVNCGAFIHGAAGNIAAENVGEYGMTSADIADAISMVFKELAE